MRLKPMLLGGVLLGAAVVAIGADTTSPSPDSSGGWSAAGKGENPALKSARLPENSLSEGCYRSLYLPHI